MNFSKSHKGFTLVELLVVIGILAILAVVVLTVLNPAEFFKKSRDSRRMVDLQTLNKALSLADFDNVSMGTSSVVYVSIPDTSNTCANLGLPAIPGWTYACSTEANYRKADGNGWVPVNFTALTTAANPLTVLPIDPINTTSTGEYYTYVNGSWELTSLFETTAYQTKYGATDNGASTILYEVGNHLKVTPNAVSWRPYMSVYPPSQSDDYVKATSQLNSGYAPFLATDPTKNLLAYNSNTWLSLNVNPQRFHIDLGQGRVITRIYYNPTNNTTGGATMYGAKNFTFWGSNTASDFADLTYANNGTWVQIPTVTSLFIENWAANVANPNYILVTNSNSYRYYAFKFADAYNTTIVMGFRRVELQMNQ